MAKGRKMTLDEYERTLSKEIPGFAEALREEGDYLEFCGGIREDLGHLRKEMRIKQADVASHLQMSQPAVSRMENGDGDMGLLALCRYAGSLGLKPMVHFAPSASTYGKQEKLETTVRALEKLSEIRIARAEDSARERQDISSMTLDTRITMSAMQRILVSILKSFTASNRTVEQSALIEIFSIALISSRARQDVENPRVKNYREGHSHAAAS